MREKKGEGWVGSRIDPKLRCHLYDKSGIVAKSRNKKSRKQFGKFLKQYGQFSSMRAGTEQVRDERESKCSERKAIMFFLRRMQMRHVAEKPDFWKTGTLKPVTRFLRIQF
jgi:CRISPR/Cas system-associated protein Cas10 (large subunit of type III CRISPR-Cas system)